MLLTSSTAIAPQMIADQALEVDGLDLPDQETGWCAQPRPALLQGSLSFPHQCRNLMPVLAGQFGSLAQGDPSSDGGYHFDPDKFSCTVGKLAAFTKRFFAAAPSCSPRSDLPDPRPAPRCSSLCEIVNTPEKAPAGTVGPWRNPFAPECGEAALDPARPRCTGSVPAVSPCRTAATTCQAVHACSLTPQSSSAYELRASWTNHGKNA